MRARDARSVVGSVPMMRAFVWVLAACWVGCGGAKAEPETTASRPLGDEESEQPEEQADEPQHDRSSGRVSELGNSQPPLPEDWELRQRDCDAIGAKHRRLLLASELEKVEQGGVGERHRAAAEQNARDAAAQGTQNWMTACESVVGTYQNKGRWDCAYKATTLARLEGCLDGRFEAETDSR